MALEQRPETPLLAAFRSASRPRFGYPLLAAAALGYSVVALLLAVANANPMPEPFLRIPDADYFAAGTFFSAPVIVAAWLLASGAMYMAFAVTYPARSAAAAWAGRAPSRSGWPSSWSSRSSSTSSSGSRTRPAQEHNGPMGTQTTEQSDLEQLFALNDDYVDSVQHSDVARFDEILADDFLCSNPDGSLVDRAQFLRQTAQPVTIHDLRAGDVRVRILGDVAIIHARTSYTTAGGERRSGRYTDVWARRNGRWLAVSAHVTR